MTKHEWSVFWKENQFLIDKMTLLVVRIEIRAPPPTPQFYSHDVRVFSDKIAIYWIWKPVIHFYYCTNTVARPLWLEASSTCFVDFTFSTHIHKPKEGICGLRELWLSPASLSLFFSSSLYLKTNRWIVHFQAHGHVVNITILYCLFTFLFIFRAIL